MKLYNVLSNNMKWLAALALPFLISSCGAFGGDERPVYHGAEYYKNLEVPPDLTRPDTGGQLRVPEPTDEAKQRFRDNNKLETVITPKFDGVRVVSYAGNSWIEIDNDVEHVWAKLLEFWQTEGVELAEQRPQLGYMETTWIKRLDADVSFFRSLFQNFEPDFKDKFRVRVERFDNDQKTRLTIANTRIERIFSGSDSDADEFIWVSRPSDVKAEREIISRMALFAGKNSEDTLTLLDNYRPYSSLVKLDRTDATILTMAGSMDFVWRRAMRALDRMQAQNIQEQKNISTIRFAIGKISNEDLNVEDDDEDELAKSSWLMQLFTDDDEENVVSNSSRQYRLEFAEVGKRVQIKVIDSSETKIVDEDGDVTGTALSEQLRNLLAENLE